MTNVPYTEGNPVVSVAVYRGQPDPKENTLIGRVEVQRLLGSRFRQYKQ